MAGRINVSTDQVLQIADNLESLNKKLTETIHESVAALNNLKGKWEGEAAQGTIANFNSFSNEFSETYENTIQTYVTFLRNQVAQGYIETEKTNVGLGDSFK